MKSILSITLVFCCVFFSDNLFAQITPEPIKPPLQFKSDSLIHNQTYPLLPTAKSADKLSWQIQRLKDKTAQFQPETPLFSPEKYTITPTGLEDNFGTKYHIRIKEPDLSKVEKMPVKIVK